MNISILTTSSNHPIYSYLDDWINENTDKHNIKLAHSINELSTGDILFLISCSQIVSSEIRNKFQKVLVIHASDLPKGRGWSPHIWEIISGTTWITLALLEAEDVIDSGNIWKKIEIEIPKTALFTEINQLIFSAEIKLMNYAIDNYDNIFPEKQSNKNSSYFPKRTPQDSEIDISDSLSNQFNLIRVCDPQRYPAYFYMHGKKFTITINNYDE
jgi:methionyl-tRNA formyltransferase